MRKKIKKRESLKLFVRREWDIALDPNRLDTTNADESKKVGLRLRRLSRIAGKSASCQRRLHEISTPQDRPNLE